MSWSKLLQAAPVRKSRTLLFTGLKRAKAFGSQTGNHTPPTLCNSLPKSGTHLLLQILRSLPESTYYHGFIASAPSRTLKERTPHQIKLKLARLAAGEIIPAHIFYDASVAQAIAEKKIRHTFIIRDPRDIVISGAHYLAIMNRWHKLHTRFKGMTLDDRLMAAIQGLPDEPGYPDIATRLKRQLPWMETPGTHIVRFERLTADHKTREQEIQSLIAYCLPQAGEQLKAHTHRAIAAIAPQKSHTYQNGKTSDWTQTFKPQHLAAFNEVAGDLLQRMGYSQDGKIIESQPTTLRLHATSTTSPTATSIRA